MVSTLIVAVCKPAAAYFGWWIAVKLLLNESSLITLHLELVVTKYASYSVA